MELPRTPEGLVTPLAVVMGARAISPKQVAQWVQVPWEQVRDWQCGREKIPSKAMAKRLALCLRWRWRDLLGSSLDPDLAWQTLLDARQRMAASR